MAKGISPQSPARWLVGLLAIGAMYWVAFEQSKRIPGLTYVNFGIHEAGHMFTYSASEMVNTMAGSVAQVAVPILIALYFLLRRDDWVGAGVCLVWAATSAVEVSLYVADAPVKELDLIGDKHDWAYILGPEGYGAMDRAGAIADQIRDVAMVGAFVGMALCAAAFVRGGRRRAQAEGDEPMVSASSATAASRP